jgi:hypothetical protein
VNCTTFYNGEGGGWRGKAVEFKLAEVQNMAVHVASKRASLRELGRVEWK